MTNLEAFVTGTQNFLHSIHPIWVYTSAVAFLFYKKAISDLEVSTGYLLAGNIDSSRGNEIPELHVLARKFRYVFWFIPSPIFAKILSPSQAIRETKERERDFVAHGLYAKSVLETIHSDFTVGDALCVLRITSQESKPPRVIASALNYIVTANVYVEFYEPWSSRRVSYIEFRLNRPGGWDSAITTKSIYNINFRVEWQGKPRLVGRILTFLIHSTFINFSISKYRCLPEQIRNFVLAAKLKKGKSKSE